MEKRARLGPVGGRIVGEVIIGLLQLDRNSFLADEPNWKPMLPTRGARQPKTLRWWTFLPSRVLPKWVKQRRCAAVPDAQFCAFMPPRAEAGGLRQVVTAGQQR